MLIALSDPDRELKGRDVTLARASFEAWADAMHNDRTAHLPAPRTFAITQRHPAGATPHTHIRRAMR